MSFPKPVVLGALVFFCIFLVVSCAQNNTPAVSEYAEITEDDTVIQVYAARTWGLKGYLAVHTWLALKRADETEFTRYEIFGWAQYRDRNVLISSQGGHDAPWFGNTPTLLLDIRGQKARKLISKVEQAIENYPYRNTYTLWPGPNSNTFTAYIGRQVPELRLDLPATAIGKDYQEIKQAIGPAVSGTGFQLNFWGLLGVTIAREEGLELNLLGLNIEFDLFDAAIELPGFGRIGRKENAFYD